MAITGSHYGKFEFDELGPAGNPDCGATPRTLYYPGNMSSTISFARGIGFKGYDFIPSKVPECRKGEWNVMARLSHETPFFPSGGITHDYFMGVYEQGGVPRHMVLRLHDTAFGALNVEDLYRDLDIASSRYIEPGFSRFVPEWLSRRRFSNLDMTYFDQSAQDLLRNEHAHEFEVSLQRDLDARLKDAGIDVDPNTFFRIFRELPESLVKEQKMKIHEGLKGGDYPDPWNDEMLGKMVEIARMLLP